MRLAVSGAGGLIGSAVVSLLESKGHAVHRLVRRPPEPGTDEILFDPVAGRIEAEKLAGLDGVVHLAGENVAARWTASRKRRIRDSRVLGTGLIAQGLAGLARGPRVLINASAIGYYGDRGEEPLDESSPPGEGFLAETCGEWEKSTEAAERAGIRIVKLRIGVVLSKDGGALKKMLPQFRLGLGGRLGGGRQFTSWIAIGDLARAILFLLERDDIAGAVNGTAPAPVTNAELTEVLARILGRPAFFHAPAFALRLALGEMSSMLLASGRILPRRLLEAGFSFDHADLESALRSELE